MLALRSVGRSNFDKGFAYFNNNVDSKRHIIIRNAILYIYIYIYIYTYANIDIFVYIYIFTRVAYKIKRNGMNYMFDCLARYINML